MRLLISGIVLLTAQCASATDCRIDAIVKHVWPEATPTAEGVMTREGRLITTNGDTPQQAFCRVWPARPELTLAAVPLMVDLKEETENYHTGDLELLVLDSATLNVKQRLRLPDQMSDDVFRITRLTLDTARWKVSPDQLAFGLHIARSGSSRVNPFRESALSLYVIENNRLRRILKGILLEDGSGEWDGNCAGEFLDIKRTLAIAPVSHQGYADIRVSEKSVTSATYINADGECATKDTPGRASLTLRYNGKEYDVPARLVPLP
ncbi:PA3715 family protein [Intestinirhabdus alba]|jgi:hypothetical protein|uniref:Uncharacterized protein n=1 Tax=Intestinirhabdus alba TaxID=2899544 RepID=A0A6L6IIQ5_9ENTR|nr:hypothetical protein [Intestinirhabdus alba]MTH46742.1 hypothetical protein [Intestinirhabdus alba]